MNKMERKYCKVGEENQCPYLAECFEKGETSQYASIGFDKPSIDYLGDIKDIKTWNNSESIKIHCIERILSKEETILTLGELCAILTEK